VRCDRGRPADHQGGLVEQLLGLAEAGYDVAAQDQVGVRIADHEHPGDTVGGGRRGGGHRPIVADRVHICPETRNVIALS